MKKRKKLGVFNESMAFINRDKLIKRQVKKNNSVVYGGQAIKAHLGPLARHTNDYDILSKKPRRSSKMLEKTLDRASGRDLYYTKQSVYHPSTHKVLHKGLDGKKNTKDDIGIADFSPLGKVKTHTIKGVKYVQLKEVEKDKRKALKDKEFAFRHKKDRNDLDRIKVFKDINKY